MTGPNKQVLPYGLWPSPVTTALISQRVRLEDVQFAEGGKTLVWYEGRGSGGVLAAQTGSSARRDLTDSQSPRGGVGYGGGTFTVGGNTLVFANRDGRIYRRSLGYESPY